MSSGRRSSPPGGQSADERKRQRRRAVRRWLLFGAVVAGAAVALVLISQANQPREEAAGTAQVNRDHPFWAFSISCGDLAENPDLKHEVALDGVDFVNSPEGMDTSIRLMEEALDRICSDADPG